MLTHITVAVAIRRILDRKETQDADFYPANGWTNLPGGGGAGGHRGEPEDEDLRDQQH